MIADRVFNKRFENTFGTIAVGHHDQRGTRFRKSDSIMLPAVVVAFFEERFSVRSLVQTKPKTIRQFYRIVLIRVNRCVGSKLLFGVNGNLRRNELLIAWLILLQYGQEEIGVVFQGCR